MCTKRLTIVVLLSFMMGFMLMISVGIEAKEFIASDFTKPFFELKEQGNAAKMKI